MIRLFAPLSLALLGAVLLGAVESEAKAQARALYAEASKALDIWTMLQLDAWSDRSGARLRSLLSGIEVLGDPLLATPAPIVSVHNLPAGTVVVCQDRVYQWAVDGRPLSLSWQLPEPPAVTVLEPAGKALGMIGRRYNDGDRIFIVAAMVLTDGTVRSYIEVPVRRREWMGRVVVAGDASAVAAEVRLEDESRLLIATGQSTHILHQWRLPRAIGPNGAWLIAENAERQRTLVTADERLVRLDDSSAGPGTAAVLIDRQVSLVRENGSLARLELPIGLGEEADLATVGEWLVVYSGSGATTKPALDVLGNLAGGGQPQLPSCALYRWRDLIAEPFASAAAVAVEATPLTIAAAQVAAIYRWRGTAVELIDLSGEEPQIRPFATAPATVTWVQEDRQVTSVALADGRQWLLDPSGRELLAPTADPLNGFTRTWAISHTGDEAGRLYQALSLSIDPAKRRAVPLQIEPGAWELELTAASDRARASRPDGQWRIVHVGSGAIVAQGDANRPYIEDIQDPPGRFCAHGPRLVLKTDPPPARQWSARDVWRNGRTWYILDHQHRVWASGRRRGEWIELGEVPDGMYFRHDGSERLAVADEDGELLAVITAQGKLETPRSGTASNLPVGSWQVRDLEYVPPRTGSQMWNSATGLQPAYLRCPEGDELLVPLGSVVLTLDPAAGRLFGRPP